MAEADQVRKVGRDEVRARRGEGEPDLRGADRSAGRRGERGAAAPAGGHSGGMQRAMPWPSWPLQCATRQSSGQRGARTAAQAWSHDRGKPLAQLLASEQQTELSRSVMALGTGTRGQTHEERWAEAAKTLVLRSHQTGLALLRALVELGRGQRGQRAP